VWHVNARWRYGLLLAAAVAVPIAVAAALLPLRGRIEGTTVAVILVAVVVVLAATGRRLVGAVAAVSATASFLFAYIAPYGEFYGPRITTGPDLATAAAVLLVGLVVGELSSRSHRHRRKAEDLAGEQAALRRVATLVANGAPEDTVFAAVAEEVGRVAAVGTGQIFRYEPDGSTVRVAAWGSHAGDHEISSPVVVDGRPWGVVVVTTPQSATLAARADQRVAGFTEQVATAISNVQARTDLAASRRRVVAAADQMRRQIERNLHDGAQQRLVTVILRLRGTRDSLPAELAQPRAELAQIQEGLASLLDELREMSRGLHPAILSEAGLGPAVKSLARRAALPVRLDLQVAGRLPEPVEAAAYYLISEALANAAKHARASAAHVEVRIDNGSLRLRVRDDGAGGADPAKGSGIMGLRDRVEALGGSMMLASPPGEGTSVLAALPLDAERQASTS
jgi:signal transduction histidine kinase